MITIPLNDAARILNRITGDRVMDKEIDNITEAIRLNRLQWSLIQKYPDKLAEYADNYSGLCSFSDAWFCGGCPLFDTNTGESCTDGDNGITTISETFELFEHNDVSYEELVFVIDAWIKRMEGELETAGHGK